MNTYQTLTDNEVLALMNSGDERAFGVVFEKYYPALCFFSSRLIADKDAAEDIVQELLYKLWHKHADFTSMESVKAFLYIGARNASLNYIDKEKRKEKHHQVMMQLPAEVTEPVLNEIIYTEALREIATELNHLPEQCGKVIKMLYQDGLKPQEIADQLGITVSTVYNQKMRGIAILKSRLSIQGFGLLLILVMTDQFVN